MASPPRTLLQQSRSASFSDSANNLTPQFSSTWTPEQEARLLHCQVELEKAQKRWSSSQELWIEEVDHLRQLKKAHLKANKKQQAQAKKAFAIWKKSTWRTLSRSSSNKVFDDSNAPSPIDGDAAVNDDDSDNENIDSDDDVADDERDLESLQRRHTGLTQDVSGTVFPTPKTISPPFPLRFITLHPSITPHLLLQIHTGRRDEQIANVSSTSQPPSPASLTSPTQRPMTQRTNSFPNTNLGPRGRRRPSFTKTLSRLNIRRQSRGTTPSGSVGPSTTQSRIQSGAATPISGTVPEGSVPF